MREARLKDDGPANYHIISRIVDRQMLMHPEEKERFRRLLRRVEAFSGCRLVTYAVLTNHFHALLHVPEPVALSDRELLCRLRCLYQRPVVSTVAESLARFREAGNDAAAERLKRRYTCRMYDLSEFVKTLKQRYTQSYNRRHGRKGTLWEERFKSVLVGEGRALLMVAAYVDLNAVRAGLVEDPGQYRFCGYGEALGGSGRARSGLRYLYETLDHPGSWDTIAKHYRRQLYTAGEQQGERGRRGLAPEAVERVLDAGGALPRAEALRCRVRYFSDGVILGTRDFVNAAFERHRGHFGSKRRTGARAMRYGDWDGLFTARRLRLRVISLPLRV